METTYFGIFTNGQTIEKHTIDELNDVDDIEFKLKCVKNVTWANPPTFTIINSDGSRNRFKVGEYEVMDIGEESPGTQGGTKQIIIKELRTGNTFQTQTKIAGVEFFKKELIPLLNALNEVGGWEMYRKSKELDRLIAKYGKLDNESTTS